MKKAAGRKFARRPLPEPRVDEIAHTTTGAGVKLLVSAPRPAARGGGVNNLQFFLW